MSESRSLLLALVLTCVATPALAEPQASETKDQIESQIEPREEAESERSALDEAPDPLFDDDFEFEEPPGFPDPHEETNRNVLKFNWLVDRAVLRPLTKGIDLLIPDPIKLAIRRVFQNFNMPVTLVNDMLQLEWKDAAVISSAFVVNSTVGLGGLFEPAKEIGLPRHRSDFGQTLALAEVESGPYLVVPVVGPSTARDLSGSIVDLALRPTTWLFFGVGGLIFAGSEGLVLLEEHHAGMRELERSSVDFYPVLKSAYYQNRVEQIGERREDRRPPLR
jgi:phospholipid-binding lipoprotein MlaA